MNPLKSEFGARMYDTGDLGRYDERGHLHFVGRQDAQLKVMGYRIEPNEIERILNRFPGVIETAVVVLEGEPSILVAGVVVYSGKEDEVNEEVLRKYCSEHLPPHMVPRNLVFLPELPKNDNGKIDRKALLNDLRDGRIPPAGLRT